MVRVLHDALHEELGQELCVLVEVPWNASTLHELYFWTGHGRRLHEELAALLVVVK